MKKRKPAPPRGKKTSVELPDDLLKRVRIQAFNEGRPYRGVLVDALEDYLRRNEKGR